jgi:hypothetical protein
LGGQVHTGGVAPSGGTSGLRVGYVQCGKVECDLRDTVCCLDPGKCVPKDDPYALCHGYTDIHPDRLACDQASDCAEGQVCCSVSCRRSEAHMACVAASECVQIEPSDCTLRQACDPTAIRPECLEGTCAEIDPELGVNVCST